VEIDGRADIYSLGMMLFEMLEGRRFFEGLEVPAIIARVVYDPNPIELSFTVADPPAAFTALVEEMVQRDRDQRPRTMDEVRDRLQHIRSRSSRP
jgi:serine/threonine-protein kinase